MGIGIDIGCRRIKMVKAKLRKNGIQLIDYGSVTTPEGAVAAGSILDIHKVGKSIAELAREMRLENKPAVAAVSGPQVYTRILTMPRMKLKDLRVAIRYEAAGFLPVPVAEVVLDIFPLREYRDEEGMKVDIFFTAVRRSQVSKIREACHLGGLKLQAIDLEPLAIKRVFNNMEETGAFGFLHIGASRTYFSILDEGMLVFHRCLSGEGQKQQKIGDGSGTGQSLVSERLIQNITAELIRSIEYYTQQKKKEVTRIIITGGGACLPNLKQFIHTGVRCKVEIGDTISRLILPQWVDQEKIGELRYDYTVALGLAARGNKS